MSPPALATAETFPESDRGTRYDDQTRDEAYQLWAFRYGRNAERVAEAM
jgi:hypothetical protein